MPLIDKLQIFVDTDNQPLLGYNIERPEPGTTSLFPNFSLGGWSLAPDLQPLKVKISDTITGAVLGRGLCDKPRPDVADHFYSLERTKTINCGFALSVDTADLQADFELLITVIPLEAEEEKHEGWEIGRIKGHKEISQPVKSLSTRRNRLKKGKLVIFDNYYPNILTGFRQAEFNYYLDKLETEIFSCHPDFEQHWQNFSKYYPEYKHKVKAFDPDSLYQSNLIYTVFLENAYKFLPYIEREGAPFIFTLYPGGGFALNEEQSDNRLRKVCRSPLLKKVIVTQHITADYLIAKAFCEPEKIELIFGGPIPLKYYAKHLQPKKEFGKHKETFDICFVANKYMPQGLDKGYDTFIKIAERLASDNPAACYRFHVVGNFNEEDIDVTNIKPYLKFYGLQPLDFFPEFYSGMDIILSPNLPFKLKPGGFDGFPTGCCVEAALNGVAIMCTDVLQMNDQFTPGVELSIITQDTEKTIELIQYYRANPAALYKMAKAGQKRCFKLYNENYQLTKRLKLIKQFL